MSLSTILRVFSGVIAAAAAAFCAWYVLAIIGWIITLIIMALGTIAAGAAGYYAASRADYPGLTETARGFFSRFTSKGEVTE